MFAAEGLTWQRRVVAALAVIAALAMVGFLGHTSGYAQDRGPEGRLETVTVDIESGSVDRFLPFDEPFLLKGSVPPQATEIIVCAQHDELKRHRYTDAFPYVTPTNSNSKASKVGTELRTVCRELMKPATGGPASNDIIPVAYWKRAEAVGSTSKEFTVYVAPLPGPGWSPAWTWKGFVKRHDSVRIVIVAAYPVDAGRGRAVVRSVLAPIDQAVRSGSSFIGNGHISAEDVRKKIEDEPKLRVVGLKEARVPESDLQEYKRKSDELKSKRRALADSLNQAVLADNTSHVYPESVFPADVRTLREWRLGIRVLRNDFLDVETKPWAAPSFLSAFVHLHDTVLFAGENRLAADVLATHYTLRNDRFGLRTQEDSLEVRTLMATRAKATHEALPGIDAALGTYIEAYEAQSAALRSVTERVQNILSEARITYSAPPRRFESEGSGYFTPVVGVVTPYFRNGSFDVIPYVGVNIALQPTNKDGVVGHYGLKQMSITTALTAFGGVKNESLGRDNLTNGTSLLVLLKYAPPGTQYVRVGAGAIFFEQEDTAVLNDETSLAVNLAFSLSIDLDLPALGSAITKLLGL